MGRSSLGSRIPLVSLVIRSESRVGGKGRGSRDSRGKTSGSIHGDVTLEPLGGVLESLDAGSGIATFPRDMKMLCSPRAGEWIS